MQLAPPTNSFASLSMNTYTRMAAGSNHHTNISGFHSILGIARNGEDIKPLTGSDNIVTPSTNAIRLPPMRLNPHDPTVGHLQEKQLYRHNRMRRSPALQGANNRTRNWNYSTAIKAEEGMDASIAIPGWGVHLPRLPCLNIELRIFSSQTTPSSQVCNPNSIGRSPISS